MDKKEKLIMKKIVATALVFAMGLSIAACNKEPEATTEATEVSETEETEAPAESSEETSEETTEETAPAIPEGYSLVELTSDYLGVKVSFAALDDGRFAGNSIELNKGTDKYGRTEYEVLFYEDESVQTRNNVRYNVRIWARSNSYGNDELKRNTPIEGIDYEGCWSSEIKDETKCHYEVFTPENSYIDGRIQVDVDMFAYADFMQLDEYKTLVDTMQKTLKIEILDTNGLNDAAGNFPSYSGVYTVPAKITMDGQECTTCWTLPYAAPHAKISFVGADGKDVEIVEDGPNVPKYVSARSDDEEKYRPVEFGGYTGICERNTGYGNVKHTYTIVYALDGEKETSITFIVTWCAPETFSSKELKDMFADEDQVAEINAKLDAYAEAFFNQIVYNG
jgi:hypothetical protein